METTNIINKIGDITLILASIGWVLLVIKLIIDLINLLGWFHKMILFKTKIEIASYSLAIASFIKNIFDSFNGICILDNLSLAINIFSALTLISLLIFELFYKKVRLNKN